MRNILSILLLAITIMFIGCSDGSASFEGASEELELIIGEEMSVQEGDQLLTEEGTVINVVHEVDSPIKKVTLLSGTAKLIRGDYVVLN